jgi:hypothetical protein
MRIFLSVASPDRPKAEEVALALRGDGHIVFLDDTDLPPADSFHERIRRAIQQADIMVFFISPASVSPSRYTLSELKFARDKWQHPKNRVLPVMVSPTPMDKIPPFLKAVTIYSPRGDLTAEVAYEVQRMGASGAGRASIAWPSLSWPEWRWGGTSGNADPAPRASSSLPPLLPSVALFIAIGFVSGLVTFFINRGWPSDIRFLEPLTRGAVFAVVVCSVPLYFEIWSPRAIGIGLLSSLAAFYAANDIAPLLFGTRGPQSLFLTGAARAVVLAAGMSLAIRELANYRSLAAVAVVGGVSELLYAYGDIGLPREIRWLLWEASVAGILCFLIGSIAAGRQSERRSVGAAVGQGDRGAGPGGRPRPSRS